MLCSPGPSLPDDARRSVRALRWTRLALAGALSMAMALGTGCGSRRAIVDHPDDSTATPTGATGGLPEGATLGERLGQLDARMRTASADSLPLLRQEYQRLLAERTGEPAIVHTGGAPTISTPSQAASDTLTSDVDAPRVEATQVSGDDGVAEDGAADADAVEDGAPARARRPVGELFTSDSPRDSLDTVAARPRREETVATAAVATGDPSRLFRGLRPSEIATIPGHEQRGRAAARGEQARRTTKARAASRRAGRDASRVREHSRPAEPVTASRSSEPATNRDAAAINARGQRKALVEGIAAARAGRYADAVAKLEPAVRAGRAGAEGSYYYALALEKSGQIDRATSQYLRASRGGGALAQRSYLDYCRLLARSGDRRKARELLTQFLRRNPDSSQAVAARRLLQTL